MNAFMCRRTSKAVRLATVILLLIALLSNGMVYAYAAEGNNLHHRWDDVYGNARKRNAGHRFRR